MTTKKPAGFRAFNALCKKLIQVPKSEIDAKVERDKARRIKKKK